MNFENKEQLFEFMQQLSDNYESLSKEMQEVKESANKQENGSNDENEQNQDPENGGTPEDATGGGSPEERTDEEVDEITEFLDV